MLLTVKERDALPPLDGVRRTQTFLDAAAAGGCPESLLSSAVKTIKTCETGNKFPASHVERIRICFAIELQDPLTDQSACLFCRAGIRAARQIGCAVSVL